MRAAAFAGALLSALVVAGCSGGGGSSTSELTKPEYLSRANAICADANQKIAALPAPDLADPAAAPEAIRAVVAIQQRAVRGLRQLGPPHTDVPAIAAWLRNVDLTLEQAGVAAKALARDDPTAVNDANSKGRDAGQEADAMARQYGLVKCTAAVPDGSPTS